MSPYILVDNASKNVLSYAGSEWRAGADDSTFLGTFNSCVVTGSPFPTLTVEFSGSAISFYGHPSDDLKFNYTIGNTFNKAADINFPRGTKGKTGVPWWSIDGLTATAHSLQLKFLSGQVIFDYLLVTPDNIVTLDGRTLALDDNDSAIKYKGKWSSEFGTGFNNGFPFQNTRHGTTNQGDTFNVLFTGSSISVYGLLNQQAGRLSSTYSIDGGAPTTFTAFDGFQKAQPDNWLLHQKFFTRDLSPGDHNLTVTVSEVTGSQAFWLDYITYQGSTSTRIQQPSATSSSPSSEPRLRLHPGVIAALAIVGFLILVSGTYFGKRKKEVWVRRPAPPQPLWVVRPIPAYMVYGRS